MGTRVYIGRLSSHVRERDVERFFKGYGRIRELMLKNGYGFVEFNDYRDADDAVYELNGKELCGERVVVEYARGPSRRGGGYGSSRRSSSWIDKVLIEHARGLPRGTDYRRERMPPRRNRGARDKYGPPVRTEYRLIVENLSSRVSWQDLKDYMRQAGEVTYADAHKQRRNEGIVEFATYSDMKSALDKLDDTEINGRRIRLVEDRPRRSRRSSSRSASRSRSRSRRSRSHSRSRSRSRNQSRSHSRDRHDHSKRRSLSRDKSLSRSRSPSHSPSPSRSQSRSPSRSHSRSRSHSKSRSPSGSKSRSRSRSPEMNNRENHNDKSDPDDN